MEPAETINVIGMMHPFVLLLLFVQVLGCVAYQTIWSSRWHIHSIKLFVNIKKITNISWNRNCNSLFSIFWGMITHWEAISDPRKEHFFYMTACDMCFTWIRIKSQGSDEFDASDHFMVWWASDLIPLFLKKIYIYIEGNQDYHWWSTMVIGPNSLPTEWSHGWYTTLRWHHVNGQILTNQHLTTNQHQSPSATRHRHSKASERGSRALVQRWASEAVWMKPQGAYSFLRRRCFRAWMVAPDQLERAAAIIIKYMVHEGFVVWLLKSSISKYA